MKTHRNVYRHLAVVQARCSSDIFSVFSAYYFTICHPTCCSANHSTFFRKDSMSASLANACMDSPKLDAILCKPCSYCSTTYIHTYIHIRHSCNPPSQNHGYGPVLYQVGFKLVLLALTLRTMFRVLNQKI